MGFANLAILFMCLLFWGSIIALITRCAILIGILCVVVAVPIAFIIISIIFGAIRIMLARVISDEEQPDEAANATKPHDSETCSNQHE